MKTKLANLRFDRTHITFKLSDISLFTKYMEALSKENKEYHWNVANKSGEGVVKIDADKYDIFEAINESNKGASEDRPAVGNDDVLVVGAGFHTDPTVLILGWAEKDSKVTLLKEFCTELTEADLDNPDFHNSVDVLDRTILKLPADQKLVSLFTNQVENSDYRIIEEDDAAYLKVMLGRLDPSQIFGDNVIRKIDNDGEFIKQTREYSDAGNNGTIICGLNSYKETSLLKLGNWEEALKKLTNLGYTNITNAEQFEALLC